MKPFCKVGSILEPIDGHYDLITCVEVLEHLPASQADPVISNLCAHADSVLFSSDPADFDEPTHLNVETTGYWAKLFAAHGFFRDFEHDPTYLAPHAMLFRRSGLDLPDLVSEYERVLWSNRTTLARVHHTLSAGWSESAAASRRSSNCSMLSMQEWPTSEPSLRSKVSLLERTRCASP